MKLTIGRQGLLLIGMPLLLQAAIFGWLLAQFETTETIARKSHVQGMIAVTFNDLILQSLNTIKLGQTVLVHRNTANGGDKRIRASQVRKFIQELDYAFEKMRVADEASVSFPAINQAIKTMVAHTVSLRTSVIDMIAAARRGQVLGMIAKTAALDHEYRMFLSDETFGNFASILVEIIESYEVNMDTLLQLNKAEQNNLMVACTAALALSGGLGVFYSRHVGSRLAVIKENAQRFAKGEPLHPLLEGSDEIAEVDRTLHGMTEELTRIAEREQAVSQLRAQVVAMVTHDLRSPLQTLSAFLRIAENKVDDEAKKGAIQEAIKEVSRMSTMIGDLLDLEKLQAKKTQLDLVPFSIATALERAKENTLDAAQESGVTISIETPSNDMVLGDEERLVQALGGLIRNAIKRSSNGSSINIRATAADDLPMTIDIQDQGALIDASALPTVFEPYAKANSEAEASDLVFALAVSKGLVELHGGSLRVKSSSPDATVFSVELPAGS